MEKAVKNMAMRLYKEKGVKTTCERCYYLSDPTCPDFPHICMLEQTLKIFGESRDWVLENLADRIEMRRRHRLNSVTLSWFKRWKKAIREFFKDGFISPWNP